MLSAAPKLCNADDIEGIAVVRADAEPISEAVVADTFLRFKGLERQVVIVSELGDASEDHDLRMHIALTRATAACFVVVTVSEIANDARLPAWVAGPAKSSAPRGPKAKSSARYRSPRNPSIGRSVVAKSTLPSKIAPLDPKIGDVDRNLGTLPSKIGARSK